MFFIENLMITLILGFMTFMADVAYIDIVSSHHGGVVRWSVYYIGMLLVNASIIKLVMFFWGWI